MTNNSYYRSNWSLKSDRVFGILGGCGLALSVVMVVGADISMKWASIPLVLPWVGYIGYRVRRWPKRMRRKLGEQTFDEKLDQTRFKAERTGFLRELESSGEDNDPD